MKKSILILLLAIPSIVYSHPLTGSWKGTGKLSTNQKNTACNYGYMYIEVKKREVSLTNIEFKCDEQTITINDYYLKRDKTRLLDQNGQFVGVLNHDSLQLFLDDSREILLKRYKNKLYFFDSTISKDQFDLLLGELFWQPQFL